MTFNQAVLRERLRDAKLTLPLAFNMNDMRRLAMTRTEKELTQVYREIQDSISGVQRANVAINHSNHS